MLSIGTQPLTVVDADSHVVEPPDLWARYAPAELADRVPHLEVIDGNDWLVCGGQRLMSAAHMSGLSRRNARLPQDGALGPGRWEVDVMRGGYETAARLADMDADGVDIGIVYPTAGLTLYSVDDRALVAQLLEAYNRWLAEFCQAGQGRLHGVGALLTDDPAAAVAEVWRCRRLGHVGLMVPLYDDRDEDFADPRWDLLWAVAEEAGLPIGFHAFVRGPGGRATITEPAMDNLVERPARVQRALLSAILGGVFTRFPGLRMVSAENEAGWAASMLERADQSFRRGRFDGGPERRSPSEVFAQHVSVTFIFDRSGLHARQVIGVGSLLWSSDYPHNVSTWPQSATRIAEWVAAAGVDDADLAALLGGNAARLYGLDLDGPVTKSRDHQSP